MILTTGGRAVGATSTRSNPRSIAAAKASSIGSTPSCSPAAVITRTGLIRIIRLTRIRFSRSFVASECLQGNKEKEHPAMTGCPRSKHGGKCHLNASKPGPGCAAASGRQAQGGGASAPHLQAGKLAGAPRSVNGKLVCRFGRRGYLAQLDSLPLAHWPGPGHPGIMLEDHLPAARQRVGQKRTLAFQGAKRLEVVSHDPGKRQMGRGGEQIADEDSGLAAALDQQHLVIGHVPGSHSGPDPGKDFAVTVQQPPAIRGHYWVEVMRQVTGPGALVGVAGKLQLAP